MKLNKNTRRLYLLAAMVFAVVLVACLGAGQPVKSQPKSQANGNDAAIEVILQEFAISLEARELNAGTATFLIHNNGGAEHDFAIRGNGIEEVTSKISPGESATLTVNLEPGTYTYLCTVSGHDMAGMSGTFTVSAN